MSAMKKIHILILVLLIISSKTDANNTEVEWGGYWPGINQGSQSPQSKIPIPSSAPTSSIPQFSSTPQMIPTAPNQSGIGRIPAAPPAMPHHLVPTSNPATHKPTLIPTTPPKPVAPAKAAQPASAPQAATSGGGTALAGIGAAFAALGTLGASSQRQERSHLNPYMGQGRTATERFNCVGKPPQQCQQEWDQLVHRIESTPGARIINKSYGCGPNAMTMMPGLYNGAIPTGYPTQPMYPPQPYGVNPAMGYPMQPPYGQQQHHSGLSSVAHSLGNLFPR